VRTLSLRLPAAPAFESQANWTHARDVDLAGVEHM
jgi:hypothetical protein